MQDEIAFGAIRCTLAKKGMANGGRFSRADTRIIEMERRIVNYAARFLFRSGPAILEFGVRVCAHYDHPKEEKKEGRVGSILHAKLPVDPRGSSIVSQRF